MTQFKKDMIHVIVAIVLVPTALIYTLSHFDISIEAIQHEATPEIVAPTETPEDVSEAGLTEDQIDYYQWVMEEAGTDTPLDLYIIPQQRQDVEYARKNMTAEQRMEMWTGLEMMRGTVWELTPRAPKSNKTLG